MEGLSEQKGQVGSYYNEIRYLMIHLQIHACPVLAFEVVDSGFDDVHRLRGNPALGKVELSLLATFGFCHRDLSTGRDCCRHHSKQRKVPFFSS